MILYLEYGPGAAGLHLDLVNSAISTETITPGAFATPSQELTQTAIQVSIRGYPNIYETTAAIGNMINQCQVTNGRGIGPRVYLYYQPADQSTTYRARVKAIAFTPSPEAGQYWKYQRVVKGEFTVIHEIWEGELTQIPLTNSYATDDIAGLQIDGTYDATHTNEASIDGLDVIGDAPTPAKIELLNNYASAAAVSRLFIGLNVYSYPATFQQVWEMENANGIGAGTVIDANYSNGNYVRLSPPGGGIGSLVYWNLTANDVRYMNGNQFHVLLRVKDGAAGLDAFYCYYHVYLANGGSALPIFFSEPMYINISGGEYMVNDLGVIRLPPWRVDDSGLTQAMRLYMLIYSVDAVAKDADIDCIHLFPVDGYRDIQCFGGLTIAQNSRLVDDMIDDEIYQDTGAATGRNNTLVGMGAEIMLQPGKDQKLMFVTLDNSTPASKIGRTWAAKVWYRPRRLAI